MVAPNNTPVVSVCVPVYNTARYLPECLDSLLAQSFTDFEIIAVDDGSADNSVEILKRYADRDPRVRYVAAPHRGVIATRNELISLARGEFIAWQDSDDIATSDRLAKQVLPLIASRDLVCLGAAWMLMDPVGLPIKVYRFPTEHDEIVKAMEHEIAVGFGASMMRRDAVNYVGGFREPFKISEDFDLCLRLSEIGRVANLPDVVLLYRQHMSSTVNSGRPRSYTYSRLARELAQERRTQGQDRLQRGETISISFDGEPTVKQNRIETHLRWAWWALAEGNLQTARKYAMRAVSSAPWNPATWRAAYCALRGH